MGAEDVKPTIEATHVVVDLHATKHYPLGVQKCLHCGRIDALPQPPVSVFVMIKILTHFTDQHRACPVPRSK